MRVAMVAARTPPFMGGIETHVAEVAPRIAAAGVELDVLTTDVTGTLASYESRGGYAVRRFPAHPRGSDLYVSPELARALTGGEYDLAHIQGVHTLLAPQALRSAAHAGLPALLTFHTGGNSSLLRSHLRGAQWRLFAPVLRTARRLIAVCEFEQRLFGRALGVDPEEIALVRNGAEPLPDGAPPDAEPGDPLVLSIGRLERYKGHHRAIAAVGALREHCPDARLVIVGSGPYEGELRRCVGRLGLEHAVGFRSFAPAERSALGALVRRSDVVVLLSEYEAHPVSVMEALGLGRDVVCADTSGLSELGREGLVRTVPLDASPETVAAAISGALRERRWRSGPPPLGTWDVCAKQLVGLYAEALACAS